MIVYLHGFNSSPQSHKAQVLGKAMAQRGLAREYICPALPPLATEVLAVLDPVIAGLDHRRLCFVGSSLGGFYATWLAEKLSARAVLINPAIDPHVGLRSYLGAQRNLHTDVPYELTEKHLEEWQALYVPEISPSRYLLLVETGDEVLDYRRAVERYSGAEQVVVQGGDHSLQSFAEHIPRLLRFCGYAG